LDYNLRMTEAEIRLLLRVTARISFVFFMGAFAGNALLALWPAYLSRKIAEKQRAFLAGLAVSHSAHLGGIVALLMTLGWAHASKSTLYGGGLVFLLLYGLVISTFVRLPFIGSPGFQTFSYWAIWMVFAAGFIPRIGRGGFIYTILGIAAIAAPALRIAAYLKRGKNKAAAA